MFRSSSTTATEASGALLRLLKKNYPAQAVKKIEMNKNEYEVELANGLDLTFNKHFQVIDID